VPAAPATAARRPARRRSRRAVTQRGGGSHMVAAARRRSRRVRWPPTARSRSSRTSIRRRPPRAMDAFPGQRPG
jgi:hypothetical protein